MLLRARDLLDELDLGVRILDVETVSDVQVDAVVDVDIRVEVFRLLGLVGRSDPSADLSRLRRCDLGLAGRHSDEVPADDGAHQHERGGDFQPDGRDPSPEGPGVGGIGRPRRRCPAGDRARIGRRPAAGRLAQGGGAQSTASACCGNGGGENSVAGGRLAGSSGWFGNSVFMTAPPDAPSRLMNRAMRSRNAADQSHLRPPSARYRRQSRGPQRSIPNRPGRR